MSKVDYNREVEFAFSYKTVVDAIKEAIHHMSGISLANADETNGSFTLNTDARLLSLGEEVSIHLQQLAPNRTKMEILSTLGVSEVFERDKDFGINRKNVMKVLDSISDILLHIPKH